jgi:hypothetical protein
LTDKAKEPVKVVDRRHFTSEGERKTAPAEEQPPEGRPAVSSRQEPSAQVQGGSAFPEVLSPFSEFVISLASSCLLSLGQIPDSSTGRAEPDLDAAGSILDVLEMLKVKTAGNLDARESDLLDQTLFQLKMTYIQARKGESS